MFKTSLSLALITFTMLLEGAQPEKEECSPCAKTMRASVRHIEAGGVGYNKGYTTLETFFASNPDWRVMPFLDLRGHVFNDAKFAVNAGTGFRTLAGCRVYGLNAYWDYRNTHRFHYNQVGVGFETLGTRWDFRLNGYLPVARKTSHPFHIRETASVGFDAFSGNNALLRQNSSKTSKEEFAMKGLDAEASYHILKCKNFDVYPAIGPYFYQYKNKHAIGGRARLCAKITEYLSLEVIDTYDNLFHNHFQGSVGINVPFGPKARTKESLRLSNCEDGYYLCQRMLQDVYRQEIIVTDQRHKKESHSEVSVAIDPATGLPYVFYFVDNTSHSAGTFESPFNTLLAAQMAASQGDIIYVFPGDGTTTGMDAGITLQNNQNLWGSAVSHSLVTNLGPIVIPRQTTNFPKITNIGGDGITLANGNNVSGLIITRAAGNGIKGFDITSTSLSQLTIFGAQQDGIRLIETVDATLLFDQLMITNNSLNGLNIGAFSAANIHTSITNSEMSLNGNTALGSGIVLASSATAVYTALIDHNTITTNTVMSSLLPAISLDSSSNSTTPLVFTLSNNLIEGNLNQAVSGYFVGEAALNVTMTNNQINGNRGILGDGVCFLSFQGLGTSFFTATNNQFNQNAQRALHIEGGLNGSLVGVIQNNDMSGNCDEGCFIGCNGSHPINIAFENNTANGNCGGGLVVAANSPNIQLNFVGYNNTFVGNCSDGIGFVHNGPGTYDSLNLALNGNVINGNVGNGFEFTVPVNNTFLFENTNNIVINNCSAAYVITGSIGSFIADFSNNTISGTCDRGVAILSTISNDFFFNASNNEIAGNCGNGIFISNNSTSALSSILTFENNHVTHNFGNGIDIQANPGGTSTVVASFVGNTIDHQQINNFAFPIAAQGIQFDYGGNSTGTSSFTAINNAVTYNDFEGIQINVTNTGIGTLQTLVVNNTVSFNRGNGVSITGNTPNTFNIAGTCNGNTLTNNNLSGLAVVSENNAKSVITLAGNTLNNNNPFLSSPSDAGLTLSNTSASSSLCASLSGNTSDTGYYLVQTAGTFNVPQTLAEVTNTNVGPVSTSGTVNFNTPCP